VEEEIVSEPLIEVEKKDPYEIPEGLSADAKKDLKRAMGKFKKMD